MFYGSLFVLLTFVFWSLWCLFLYDLRILITPSYRQTKLLPSASNLINYENRRVGDKRLTDSRVLIFLTGISQIHFLVVTVHVLYLNFHPSATVALSNSTQSFLAVLAEKNLLLLCLSESTCHAIFRTDHDVGKRHIGTHTIAIRDE